MIGFRIRFLDARVSRFSMPSVAMVDARPQGQVLWVSYTAYICISSTDAMQREEETGICSVCMVHSPAIHEYASVFTFRRANVISVHGLEGNVHVRKPVDVRVTLDPNLGSDPTDPMRLILL